MSDKPSLGLPEYGPNGLTHDEVSALLEMFASAGWGVFMRLRKDDADATQAIINNITTEDRERFAQVAAWNAIDDDRLFEARIRDALRTVAKLD
jgi:hypothetical protein